MKPLDAVEFHAVLVKAAYCVDCGDYMANFVNRCRNRPPLPPPHVGCAFGLCKWRCVTTLTGQELKP
jgi:hypothetical protein